MNDDEAITADWRPVASSFMPLQTIMNDMFPLQGRLMALDVGNRRVGIAVSDEMQMLATPLTVLTRRSRQEDAQRLGTLAGERAVVGLVIGLPLHADGSDGPQARQAARYGHRLANDLGLPATLWNEHGSTQEAAERLEQAGRRGRSPGLDAEAAAVILQDYLDAQRSAAATTEVEDQSNAG